MERKHRGLSREDADAAEEGREKREDIERTAS